MKDERINVYHQVSFSGVSGSNHVLNCRFDDSHQTSIVVDAGLFMSGGGEEEESKEYNMAPLNFNPNNVSALFITHAHSDHEGLVPYVVKNGYNGPIYCSKITASILPIAWTDSCKCLTTDGMPIYDKDDVSNAISHVDYLVNGITRVVYEDEEGNNINATIFDNGHLPGASSLLLQFSARLKKTVNIFFSGDIKMSHPLFNIDPYPLWVRNLFISEFVIESTYGSTLSNSIIKNFMPNVSSATNKGWMVLCPVLSLDRSPIVLNMIRDMKENNLIPKDYPVYYIGPLGTKYLQLYNHNPDIKEKMKVESFLPEGFAFSSVSEIKDKIDSGEHFIVLAAPGMGQLGASLELMEKLCTYSNSLIQFTSYVPPTGIASTFINAKKGEKIKLRDGSVVPIQAEIKQTIEFSQHAKADELFDILEQFPNKRTIAINHGSPKVKEDFAKYITECGVTTVRDYQDFGVLILNRATYLRVTSKGVDKIMNSDLFLSPYIIDKAKEERRRLKNKKKRKEKTNRKFN